MQTKNTWTNPDITTTLNKGGVVVMPTDTIYGIVARAEDEAAVTRVYKIRNRDIHKPCIILIGEINELKKFSIHISKEQESVLNQNWPFDTAQDLRPTSIILDCPDEKFEYLHRRTQTLAFRVPIQKDLREFLMKSGPLIAPSANLATRSPSENIIEAESYFGNSVDLYVDGGLIMGKASKVIKLHKDGTMSIIRE